MKKISVIMGIYNCADTLDEAIKSILSQTYINWELIMCDDASTDGSYEIAQKYVNKYPDRVKLIRNITNQGLNITLNNCLEVVTGEYVARMDGDDISLPERLEREARFLDDHDEFAFVSCPMIYFDKDGDFAVGRAKEKTVAKDLLKGGVFCHAPCMIRKDVYEEVEGYTVDKRLLRVEDFNLWHKIYAKGYKGYNLQEPLYKMRDDKKALKRRTLRSRLNGTYAVYIGYKLLDLPWYYIVYVAKDFIMNIIKTVIPISVYSYFHRKK